MVRKNIALTVVMAAAIIGIWRYVSPPRQSDLVNRGTDGIGNLDELRKVAPASTASSLNIGNRSNSMPRSPRIIWLLPDACH